MHMFIARYCDLLNVVISCDGCERMAPWHRYRCLQCMDMDLCKTCFLSKCMTAMIRGPSRSRGYSLWTRVCVNQVVRSLKATRTIMRW